MERNPKGNSESSHPPAPELSQKALRSDADDPQHASPPRGWISWYLRNTEVIVAVLLSIATVATAWSAYQSARWNGVQATSFAEASTTRSESDREFNLAIQLQIIDTELVTNWIEAHRDGDSERMDYYETWLMRPELLKHLDEWAPSESATDAPGETEGAHPLVSDAYLEELVSDSTRLQDEAVERTQHAKEANQSSDNYVLATVIFASVLFFAGIAGKLSSRRTQGILLGLGFLMLVTGAVWLAILPVH
jgi:hypothetical protein